MNNFAQRSAVVPALNVVELARAAARDVAAAVEQLSEADAKRLRASAEVDEVFTEGRRHRNLQPNRKNL